MSGVQHLPASVKGAWHQFLESYEPLRPELYRYCRHLTRSPWDAEDLAQDTLMRGFVTLGQLGEAPPNPRAWLFRVAYNGWLDRVRRSSRQEPLDAASEGEGTLAPDPRLTREVAGTLLEHLAPQERAALVLKDVFACSLEETAETLSTSVGAVKAALHRGRGKLVTPPRAAEAETAAPPPRPVLDAFCAAFNRGDLDALTALLLDTTSVEVVGATTQYGREAARRTVLFGMLFGVKVMVDAERRGGVDPRFFRDVLDVPPRVEARVHRGEWVLLHWYTHRDGDAVRALTRVEAEDEHVVRLWNFFYSPELVSEVCGELSVPFRSNGQRWWLEKRAT